jgi:hypothetical protein
MEPILPEVIVDDPPAVAHTEAPVREGQLPICRVENSIPLNLRLAMRSVKAATQSMPTTLDRIDVAALRFQRRDIDDQGTGPVEDRDNGRTERSGGRKYSVRRAITIEVPDKGTTQFGLRLQRRGFECSRDSDGPAGRTWARVRLAAKALRTKYGIVRDTDDHWIGLRRSLTFEVGRTGKKCEPHQE